MYYTIGQRQDLALAAAVILGLSLEKTWRKTSCLLNKASTIHFIL